MLDFTVRKASRSSCTRTNRPTTSASLITEFPKYVPRGFLIRPEGPCMHRALELVHIIFSCLRGASCTITIESFISNKLPEPIQVYANSNNRAYYTQSVKRSGLNFSNAYALTPFFSQGISFK